MAHPNRILTLLVFFGVSGLINCASHQIAKADPVEISLEELEPQCREAIRLNRPSEQNLRSPIGKPYVSKDDKGNLSVGWGSTEGRFYPNGTQGEMNAARAIGASCTKVIQVVFSGPTGGTQRWYLRRNKFTIRHSRDSGYPGDYDKYWGKAGTSFDYDPTKRYSISPVRPLPVFQRYPTNAELNQLMAENSRLIQRAENDSVGRGYIKDRRTASEKEALKSFIKAWSGTNPGASPYFGSWQGWDAGIAIYPSSVKEQVCIIYTGEGRGAFSMGKVLNGKIYTDEFRIIFKKGIYMGEGGVTQGKPVLTNFGIPYNNPRPLEKIDKYAGARILDREERFDVISHYNRYGCRLDRAGI